MKVTETLMGVKYGTIILRNPDTTAQDIMRLQRATELKIMPGTVRQIGSDIWTMVIASSEVIINIKTREASCKCADFNFRMRAKGKPCKHIYRAIMYICGKPTVVEAKDYLESILLKNIKRD